VNQDNHTTLIKIEGLNDKKDVAFYQGKRVAYIYRVRQCRHLLFGV
jgi:large subunit ribosomal protein L35Ae